MQLGFVFFANGVKMGTYTTNYNLFMPTVGEQGWGELVNGNFSTIDTTMAGLNTRLTAVESEVNGNLSCTSVTTSGKVTANGGVGTTSLTTSSTITSTGLITANGGVKGLLFVKGNVQTSGDATYATCAAVSFNVTTSYTSSNYYSHVVPNYSISYSNFQKHTWGVYTRKSDLTGTTSPSASTRAYTFKTTSSSGGGYLYWKKSTDSSWQYVLLCGGTSYGVQSKTVNLTVGATYYFYHSSYGVAVGGYTITAPALSTYYVKYATP